MFDLNPNFLNKLPPEDVRGEQRKLGQIKTKFRKTYLILFKIIHFVEAVLMTLGVLLTLLVFIFIYLPILQLHLKKKLID